MTASSVWLVRHGETEWSRDGRHTSLTDVPLTEAGVAAAREVGRRLAGRTFALVLTSPRLRARRTAELAGFPGAVVDDDLAEWFYGTFEGITTAEIRKSKPRWTLWDGPVPGGERASDVGRRVDRVIGRVRAVDGDSLLFGHGHSLRVLTARWLGQPVADGRLYRLDTGTISVLGYENGSAVVDRWNA
ncbi:MAG TPA: histidine phosphatase family protein [Gaiella sp.]|nr:histidine phosphatase family protein [Gaiella sp.]